MAKFKFTDNKGRSVLLDGSLTIGDLTKAGIRVKLDKPSDPLPDNWFAHTPKPLKRKSK